ncbi:hypothetical protein RES13_01230 [Staphylococcus cohnii]|uniref:hypothetical protein n=1 Tax=Staphylococcus cohnii TaxID=29382 RepID=UPI0008FB59DE|nr:hypothetical protein [Staphylococcus cohnii]TGP59683.1 hypothetical protein EN872_12505 [bacterium M00.F.Ca.ET.229.01.1.1]TGS36482.1 hypothetical protein EN823_12495 [bacterium M00.F.Ca.ET.180.01.1.1]OIS36412.1 hypothetical protein RES12_10305 [Staphylococcus cohnii]OIS38099.1 hypothetical protein RES11_03280 [Staphylococcus cohnii]OIS40833.1 hypothetical protein RES13_01230 [Staphylococcus cohnii]
MKKLFFMLLASFLILSACGNEEESKSEDKKETKSEDKDKETDKEKESDKKDNKSNNKDEKSNEEVANNKDKPNETSQEKQKMENKNNTQQQNPNINNNEGPTQQGNRPFGGIPPKGMTNEEYQLLENNMPNANNVSNEEYEKLLNEQVQRIANKNNHSIETPMGTFTPNNQNENTDQNQKIDLNKMPAGDFSTEGMSEQAKNKIEELTRQKDFEGLSQEEYNDRVSEIMNEEMNNN